MINISSFRQKVKEQGGRRLDLTITPAGWAAIQIIKAQLPNLTYSQIGDAPLQCWAKQVSARTGFTTSGPIVALCAIQGGRSPTGYTRMGFGPPLLDFPTRYPRRY